MDAAIPNPSPWPKWLRWLAVSVAVAVLVAGVAYAIFMHALLSSFKGPYDGRDQIQFSRDAWLAAKDSYEGERFLMLEDLLDKEPLEGRSRGEVEALLGPLIPPTEYPGGDSCYFLGPEPSWASVDNIWLGIEFDLSDCVVATRTFTD